ncbi:MAG: alpha/beta hydrolase [Verrucomicrobiota bacterium]
MKILFLLLRAMLIIGAGTYIIIFLMLTSFQKTLIYPGVKMYFEQGPDRTLYQETLAASGYEIWKSESGKSWGLKQLNEGAEFNWMIFYGNGDHALRAAGWGRFLEKRLPAGSKANYYILEYPGYALNYTEESAKTISEETVIAAAIGAWEEIPKDKPVMVFGQSMGAAVAIQTAAHFPDEVSGVLLTNPYTTLADAAGQYLNGLLGPLAQLFPLTWMLEDQYISLEHIQKFSGPVAMVAGEQDTLTPPRFAEQLYAQVKQPAGFWIQEDVGHWVDPNLDQEWNAFVIKLLHHSIKGISWQSGGDSLLRSELDLNSANDENGSQ